MSESVSQSVSQSVRERESVCVCQSLSLRLKKNSLPTLCQAHFTSLTSAQTQAPPPRTPDAPWPAHGAAARSALRSLAGPTLRCCSVDSVGRSRFDVGRCLLLPEDGKIPSGRS